jgi:hypothetical protein
MKFSRSHPFILLLGVISLFPSCSDQAPTTPNFDVNRVVTLQTYGLNSGFRLEFYGNNYEAGFAGYDVYISRSNMISTLPMLYKGNGSASLAFGSIDPSVLQSFTISVDGDDVSLTNGRKYYVWMTAVNALNGKLKESAPSTISLVTPLTQYDFSLGNHADPGTLDDSITINPFGVPAIGDAPDTIPKGTISFFFELRMNNGQALPYISTRSNNVYIQDLGTFQDISYAKNLPLWPRGWTGPESSVLAVQGHVVGLYLDNYGFYGKIFFISVPSPQSGTTVPAALSIKCVIQVNPGLSSF